MKLNSNPIVAQYSSGDAIAGTKGVIIWGSDGTVLRHVKTDAAGELQVDVLSMPTTTVQANNLDIRDLNSATDSVTVVGGGGTQYTEGDVDAAITGTAAMMETAGNVLAPLQGSVANGLSVNIVAATALVVDNITNPVAVTQSGVWDEVGINDSGNSITVDNAALSVVGGGLEATALRVTIANDSTGVVSVDDNGGSLTVDGTVTANAGTNLNTSALALETGGNLAGAATSLAVMDDWDETDRAKVNLIVGQAGIAAGTGVDGVTVPRVTLATNVALPAGTNVIGALSANQSVNVAQINGVTPLMGAGNTGTGSHRVTIATDQVVIPVGGNVAHNAVDSGNPVKLGMRAVNHGAVPTALAAADRTDWLSNRDGVPFVMGGHMNLVTIRYTATAAGTNASIVAGVSNTKIIVTRVSATVNATSTSTNTQVRVGFAASITPTTTGVLLSHPGLAPGSGIVEGNGSGILGISANADAILVTHTSPATGTIDIVISYYVVLEN